MYVKIQGRFFHIIITDEYSIYIVHHSLLTATEAQTEIDKLMEDRIAEPVIQSDNGSSFIAMEFRMMLKRNNLTPIQYYR